MGKGKNKKGNTVNNREIDIDPYCKGWEVFIGMAEGNMGGGCRR